MKLLRTLAALVGLLLILVAHASQSAYSDAGGGSGSSGGDRNGDDGYERLDGTGPSGVKVNFIEWEGNAEIHFYPKGVLVGLGLKLVKNEKGAYVFVQAYRFRGSPKTVLIRRNVLSDKWVEGYKVYRAPSDDDYDKIVISPNTLSDMTAFKLDPAPTQLYPDGHPAIAARDSGKKEVPSVAKALAKKVPEPKVDEDSSERATASDEGVDDAGTVRPFFMEPQPRHLSR
jgi:hypothetical protein